MAVICWRWGHEEATRFLESIPSGSLSELVLAVHSRIAGICWRFTRIRFRLRTTEASTSYTHRGGGTRRCSLRGGEGSIIGIIIGTALFQVLQNVVNLLSIPSSLNFTVMGAVVLIGVLADQIIQRRSEKKLARR